MSVRRSLAWSYGGHAIAFVFTFGASVVVARILSPRELGVFALALAATGVLAILSAFGVGPYLVREQHISPAKSATAFTVNGIVNVSLALAILMLGSLGSAFLAEPSVGRVLKVLAILPIIGIFEFLPLTMLTREMRFSAISLITITKAIVNSLTVVLLAWDGWSSLSLPLAAVASGLFGVAAYNFFARRHVSLRLSLTNWREIATFGLHMMSIGGVASAVSRISEIVLAKLLGLAALGLYARATSVANPAWDAYGLATRVIFVQMAAEHREYGTARDTFMRATQIITAIMWPATIGLAVLSRPFVHLVYGDKWLQAAGPLAILMLAQFVALTFGMNWELCVLSRRTSWQARVEIARAMIGLAAFSFGAMFNIVGAAAGRVIEASVGFLLYRPKMEEMIGSPPGELSRAYSQSALVTAGAVAPSGILMIFTGWSQATNPAAILVVITLGLAIWWLLLGRLDHPLAAEIKSVVARVTRGAPA
jgi:O-antigen/teichoic acid export membrane protein